MKIIIAGSRENTSLENGLDLLDTLLSSKIAAITAVLCGEARGADTIGRHWAKKHNIPVKSFPAEWETFGKRAGFVRNTQMAQEGDVLVALWDGTSRGTKHMIDTAIDHGIWVKVIHITTGQ